MEIKMTDATFQPNMNSNETATGNTSTLVQLASSFRKFLFNGLFAKRPVNATAILAANSRHEAARRSVDNLLR